MWKGEEIGGETDKMNGGEGGVIGADVGTGWRHICPVAHNGGTLLGQPGKKGVFTHMRISRISFDMLQGPWDGSIGYVRLPFVLPKQPLLVLASGPRSCRPKRTGAQVV